MSDGRKPWQRRHKHLWTKWENMTGAEYVKDVRHCEVCNMRETRYP